MKAMPKRPDIESLPEPRHHGAWSFGLQAPDAIQRVLELIHDMDRSEKEDAQRHHFIQHRGARLPPLVDQMKQSVRRRFADEVADVLVQISLYRLFSHECC